MTTPRPARSTRAAFSLFELLIVVGIILVMMILTVPSFATLVKSNNFSSAVNQLAGGLEAARERAIARNRETAVAVLFDIETRQTSLLILDAVGSRGALALSPAASSGAQNATVFVPASNSPPIVLPEGTAIFGLSTHHVLPDGDNQLDSIDNLANASATYETRLISDGTNNPDELDQRTTAWYTGSVVPDPDDPDVLVNTWLAPRNDPRVYLDPRPGERDIDLPVRAIEEITYADLWGLLRDGNVPRPGFESTEEDAVRYMRHAQSFMIRFSPQGRILAVSSDTGQVDQAGYAYLELPENPVASGAGVPAEMVGKAFDAYGRFDPEAIPRNQTEITPSPFSYESAGENPEVILRAVSRLAVVDLQDLYKGTGVSKPWLLHPSLTDAASQAPWPDVYSPGDGPEIMSTDEELDRLVIAMSKWIDENAVLLDFSRFSGRVMKR